MALGDRRSARIISLVQAKVPEPVEAAAILAPRGKFGAAAGFGAIGAAVHNSTQTHATGFAPYNAFGVTASGIYVFEAGVNLGLKVREQIGYWPWGTFDAMTSTGSMTRFLTLMWNDGSRSELESQVLGVQKFQGDVIVTIVGRARRAVRAQRGEAPPDFAS